MIDNKPNGKENDIKWHNAFYAATQLDFYKDRKELDFINEYCLSKEPLRIDVKIVKKISDKKLNNEIGAIFRKHNIIEYKSPDDFYKVYGYGCFYKSLSNKVDEININEITLTFCCKKKPIKLIKHLKEIRNYNIIEKFDGIFYVLGDYFPIQIVLNTKLNKEKHIFLKGLDNELKDLELVKEMANRIDTLKDSSVNINALFNVLFRANLNIFKEVAKMSNTIELQKVMTEIMYEQGLDKTFIEQGKEEEKKEIAKKLLTMKIGIEQIVKATELSTEKVKQLQEELKNSQF